MRGGLGSVLGRCERAKNTNQKTDLGSKNARVQVMALVAHLMEEKNNYGPHLIVVPNAVLVNWKAELGVWLPGAPPPPLPFLSL